MLYVIQYCSSIWTPKGSNLVWSASSSRLDQSCQYLETYEVLNSKGGEKQKIVPTSSTNVHAKGGKSNGIVQRPLAGHRSGHNFSKTNTSAIIIIIIIINITINITPTTIIIVIMISSLCQSAPSWTQPALIKPLLCRRRICKALHRLSLTTAANAKEIKTNPNDKSCQAKSPKVLKEKMVKDLFLPSIITNFAHLRDSQALQKAWGCVEGCNQNTKATFQQVFSQLFHRSWSPVLYTLFAQIVDSCFGPLHAMPDFSFTNAYIQSLYVLQIPKVDPVVSC